MMKSIQRHSVLQSNLLVKACFINKKKVATEFVLDINDILQYIERINKSKLVVFNVQEEDKNALLKELSNLAILRKHYSPIVEVGNSKVFLFPQLNYSDMYLLRSLFQQKYANEEINTSLVFNAIVE